MAVTCSRPEGSAAERLERAATRISAPELEGAKAFTELLLTSARAEAQAADARAAAGRRLGPFDGRIVSVKALFDVASTVTSAGSAVLRGRLGPAVADAAAVARLRQAGAVIVGKTQMTEFAFSAVGSNPHDPPPGNPHDRGRAPGGSSSGAVVSVVDGMAEIGIGSDTGGSIRIPAALSGAVGFKPTGGRLPTAGAFSLSSTLDTVGSIARSVADCAAADQVLSGRASLAALRRAAPGAFRLVIARGRPFEGSEPEVLEAFESSVIRLREAGLTVGDGALDAALDAISEIDAIGTFPSVEVGATLRSLGISALDGVDPNTRVRIEAGAAVSAVDYVRMARLRSAAVRSFEGSFPERDVFVLPTTPIRAPRLSALEAAPEFHRVNGLLLRNPRIANLLDCPSISLPLPTQGLPVGMMLIGRRGSDRRLLEIAACLEAVLAGASGA